MIYVVFMFSTNSTNTLLEKIRNCRICAADLPLGPGPVLQFHPGARILIAGQAPGRKVHASGIPFEDASGKRLRNWIGVNRDLFYDAQQIAILPMGFCYPGTAKSGDLPPRPECAPAWRELLMERFLNLKCILVIGQYAHKYYFRDHHSSLTERVKAWNPTAHNLVPMPHPSPRNNLWLRRNPWFEAEMLPMLRNHVSNILTG